MPWSTVPDHSSVHVRLHEQMHVHGRCPRGYSRDACFTEPGQFWGLFPRLPRSPLLMRHRHFRVVRGSAGTRGSTDRTTRAQEETHRVPSMFRHPGRCSAHRLRSGPRRPTGSPPPGRTPTVRSVRRPARGTRPSAPAPGPRKLPRRRRPRREQAGARLPPPPRETDSPPWTTRGSSTGASAGTCPAGPRRRSADGHPGGACRRPDGTVGARPVVLSGDRAVRQRGGGRCRTAVAGVRRGVSGCRTAGAPSRGRSSRPVPDGVAAGPRRR